MRTSISRRQVFAESACYTILPLAATARNGLLSTERLLLRPLLLIYSETAETKLSLLSVLHPLHGLKGVDAYLSLQIRTLDSVPLPICGVMVCVLTAVGYSTLPFASTK